jgi:hypothetical protein
MRFMKCKFLICLALICPALALRAQNASVYENDGLVFAPPDVPPMIDATHFVNANNGQFIINFTNDFLPGLFYGFGMSPFETQNTLTYSNDFGAIMACNTGFRFQTFDSVLGRSRPAASFFNGGLINCGTTDTLNFFELSRSFFFGTTQFLNLSIEGAKCSISANDIVNPGTIHMGFESYLDMHGSSIDLSYGTLTADLTGFSLENETFNAFFSGSIFDGYWGVGDVRSQTTPPIYPNGINPRAFFGSTPPFTHTHVVTTRNGLTLFQQLGGPTFLSYLAITSDFSGTNIFITAVFSSNTNADVGVNVYFPTVFDGPAVPIIEYTNLLGTSSNNVYVQDLFGATTNLQLLIDGVAGGRATSIPFNYTVVQSPPIFFFGPPSPPTSIPPTIFPNTLVTNQWSGYQAILSPLSVFLGDLAGQNFTNIPGGMRITADKYLNLSNSHIESLNYLLLKATNHFDIGTDARIASPAVDLNLRTTNGFLLVSNLLASSLNRPGGIIDLFSARWTNTLFGGTFTNHYHVLFADAQFSPTSPSLGQDVILRTTGAGSGDSIVINDALTITHSMLLDAARITIATNQVGTDPPAGSITITDPRIVWPTSTPRLQFFTNNGSFTAPNAVFFGGSRSSPYYTTTFTEPYQTFINSGTVRDFGSIIEANIFQNSGLFFATGGSISLLSQDTLLTNGAFLTVTGSVSITTSSLVVSNHALVGGGGPISLSASYLLDDGTLAAGCPEMVTNKNLWLASGFNLTRLPTYATLLSTTVTNIAWTHNTVQNTWAGNDLGPTPNGFNPNNAPVGRIFLDGRDPAARFNFSGASANNALYVDYLELDDYATNYDAVGQRYLEVTFAPNMKIYFGQAVASGVSIAEKLNGANGGHFVWVSNYNCGPFSSVTLTNLADGTTYTVNRGLRESCTLDSDNDGIPNCLDATPIPFPASSCPCSGVVPPPISSGSPSFNPGGGGSSNTVSDVPQLDAPPPGGSGAVNQTVAQNKGSYVGLFFDTNGVSPASAGSVSASVTDKGSISGHLMLGGKSYSFSARLDSNGFATAKVSRGVLHSLNVQIHLDLSGANQITGSVTDSHWTAQLLANRIVFDAKKSPASQFVGTYTLDIPGDVAANNRPSGDGFASVKVDAGGNVQLAGALADGSKLSLKTVLSGSGSWPLYVSLYQGAGCGLGWLQVTNHTVSGRFVWIRPAGAASSTKSYPAGFTNRVDTSGLRYGTPAAGQSLFNWNYGSLILSGGGLSSGLTNLLFVNDQNRLTISDDPSLKLTITLSSGLFQGSILTPSSTRPIKFQGALFQDLNLGLGYFLNSDQSGQIYLGPAP